MSVVNHHRPIEKSSSKPLGYYLLVVSTALLSGFYVQYLADTFYGLVISYLMLAIIIISSFISLEKAVRLCLLISLITPQFSRDLVEQVVSSNNQEVEAFYSFHSVQFGGLGLSVIAIIFVGFIALCRIFYQKQIIDYKEVSSFLRGLYLIFLILLLATFVSSLIGRTPEVRYIISDFRMIVIWGVGALVAILVSKTDNIIDKIYSILLFSVLVIGLRTLFFFINDFVTGKPNLEYATQAYIAYPLMFVFAMTIRNLVIRLFMTGIALLAAISMKREDIAFVFLCVVAVIYLIVFLNDRGLRRNALLALMLLIVVTSFAISSLAIYSPQSFDFLLYKFDFFSKLFSGNEQSSGSVLVRLYELQNIIGYSINHIYPVFIGMGFGGYFDFGLTGFPIVLGVSDYSINEIAANQFVRPHSFTNYIYLKGGLIFLSYYIFIIIKMMRRSFGLMRATLKEKPIYCNEFRMYLFSFLYAIFCVNMFWQPVHNFLFAFLLVLLLVRTCHFRRKKSKNEDFNC